MASRADRHRLYEQSVQNTSEEVRLLERIYEEIRGNKPRFLREDFCGTAKAACDWVEMNPRHRAVGVDIDPNVLAWAERNNLSKLKPGARRRIKLVNDDVMRARTDPVDIVTAFNFSYWVFKRRDDMRRYLTAARHALAADGLLMLDAFGGAEAYSETSEDTAFRRFTYVWEQASYDPISGDFRCYIHFRFPDGSRIKQAFTYDWRLWSLPELRELLTEAGFRRSVVYWEQTGEDGEFNGEYEQAERGEADPAWIAYIVAEK